MTLETLLRLTDTRVTAVLASALDRKPVSTTLKQALDYVLFNGGKRLRPLLVYAAGITLEAPLEALDVAAGAVEMMHAYSLVHDDLPCMDNADLRRGKPACHKAFGEAMAVLAGDALQPLAFELLATHPAPLSAAQRIRMITVLSHATGMDGMVAGQVQDMEGVASLQALQAMYRLKTGVLLKTCLQLAAIAARATTPVMVALERFAADIGLAFQIRDDLLDFENSTVTGKPAGLDRTNQKKTWPDWAGIPATRQKISELLVSAEVSVASLREEGMLLREAAKHVLQWP